MATFDAHANLAWTAVATAPSPAASGTSLVVTAGHGARFPATPFNVVIAPADTPADPTNAEIVRVTARSTDTLTIVRAQEGTAARTVVVGDRIAATVTARTLTDIEGAIGTGAVYYVSNAGSDAATGRTPATAFATLAPLAGLLSSGDTVRLQRGGTFYGRPPQVSGVTWEAYGAGPRPVLSAYKICNTSGSWSNVTGNQWRIDITSSGTHTGWNTTTITDIGFLRTNGTVRAVRRTSTGALAAQWEFYTDAQYLWVYSVGNPTTVAADIRAAVEPATGGGMFSDLSDLVVRDLEIVGSGGHGVNGDGDRVLVERCVFHEIGGAYLSGTTRYGNAIEAWIGSTDWLVRDNEIYDVYDAGLTAQGTVDARTTWRNLAFLDNDVHDCTYLLELFASGSFSAGQGMLDVTVRGNEFRRGGGGPFAFDHGTAGTKCAIFTGPWDVTATTASVVIENNLFSEAVDCYRFSATLDTPGITYENNRIELEPGQLLHYQYTVPIEDGANWQGWNSVEAGSVFTILGAGKKFTDLIGNGTDTVIYVTHNFGTFRPAVSIWEVATNELVRAKVIASTANVIEVTFDVAPATDAYEVAVHA